MNKLKIFIFALLILWSAWNVVDILSSAIDGYNFLFGQVIVFFIYILPALAILFFLSLSLKKSGIKWGRTLGIIGISVCVLNIVVNIVALIWNLMYG